MMQNAQETRDAPYFVYASCSWSPAAAISVNTSSTVHSMMAFHVIPVRPFLVSAPSGAEIGILLRAALSWWRTPVTFTMSWSG